MAAPKERTPTFVATIRLKTDSKEEKRSSCCLIVEGSYTTLVWRMFKKT